ncbi:MAG: N-6 DNA methylase [Bacteroidales bacterium]|nr:N-6 DNA methylase [Bacteroidales bacterium]
MKDIYQDVNNFQTVEISKAATLLDISIVTIRNWIKYGYLQVNSCNDKNVLLLSEVMNLRSEIANGTFTKLNSRANKSKASKVFVPNEYSQDNLHIKYIYSIVKYIHQHHIPTSTALALLSLNLLQQEGLLSSYTQADVLAKRFHFTNPQIGKEIQEWISTVEIKDDFLFLTHCPIPNQKDVLGFIYQSMMNEGEKSKAGSYYTPAHIVEDIVHSYVMPDSKVLDPCCGTGQFLLALAEKIGNPLQIYGIDVDAIAVKIARLNLLIAYKNLNFNPHIYHQNSLFDIFEHRDFDLVTTNPPWGFHFTIAEKKQLKTLFPPIITGESFSLFLKKSIDRVCDGGRISFSLPESILYVKKHKDIRQYILNQTNIYKIFYLDRVFKNVFTPIIRLDLIKHKDYPSDISVCKKNKTYQLTQSKWEQNPDHVFDIHVTSFDDAILNKLYSFPHITLQKQADWALGIVTGNNKKFISPSPQEDYEEIYGGKDIDRFRLKKATQYIHYRPDLFQQTASEAKYRAKEKLIYRFISKNLIFAYDDKQKLSLNSANILIPRIPDYPIMIIAALFNSLPYQYMFQKQFASIKVLRCHLEQLPIPILTEDKKQQLLQLCRNCVLHNTHFMPIDQFIQKEFGLSTKEISYMKAELL